MRQFGILVALLLVGGALFLVGAATPLKTQQKWEYREWSIIDRFPEEDDLNKLGKDGWEMTGTLVDRGTTRGLIFKRRPN